MSATTGSESEHPLSLISNRYVVCLLDVLGFKSRFESDGLSGILKKYIELVDIAKGENDRNERVFAGNLQFDEAPYWSSDGDVFIFSKVFASYASDSVLIFSHVDFPESRYPATLKTTAEERKNLGQNEEIGWMYHPVPSDNFLDTCNEMICRSVEIGLPLRGAISMGEAILHIDRGIYLGQPLIDTSGLEREQLCIGVSFARPFMEQIVPKRYAIPFDSHFKAEVPLAYSGSILDWPRHWRNTRKQDLVESVRSLDRDTHFKKYYDKTIETIEASAKISHQFEKDEDTFITKVYPQFSSKKLRAHVRAVRKVLLNADGAIDNAENH